jgi:hypothetical protein
MTIFNLAFFHGPLDGIFLMYSRELPFLVGLSMFTLISFCEDEFIFQRSLLETGSNFIVCD